MTIYFISGQGADEKLFENLALPATFTIKYVTWIEPLMKEPLFKYVKRLSRQIDSTEDFAFVGVSFGGIVAVELNKILRPKKTIIISSIVTRDELPPHFRFINFIKLHKIVPSIVYKWHNPFVNWYFGAKTKREKEMLRFWMRSSSKNYMRWAALQILSWSNKTKPSNLFHIHGTSDRIFLHQFTGADVKIKNGSHLMVHNKAAEISRLILEKLNTIPE